MTNEQIGMIVGGILAGIGALGKFGGDWLKGLNAERKDVTDRFFKHLEAQGEDNKEFQTQTVDALRAIKDAIPSMTCRNYKP